MASMRDELDRAIRRNEVGELESAVDRALAQMEAALSYYVEARADFSVAAGNLALHHHRNSR